ncbi:NADPH:quinone reductase [Protaetiibacter intestinalis]|uniref:NADPH:quinone reductase n=1 Tax=Protaetiibacter intestinalis TaxID=2419774 RepID=A0A387BFE8_9MICO|nr:NADPH:quinone reductase [Protaetiibacter intestinalis]AYF97220.1 NADPH:quinone reductase [Protaetiibacter intestinalis]
MKSVAHFKPGDVSVLEMIERPVPVPGPGEVLVRLAVAGVNPTDIDARRSRAGKVQHFREPHIPGQDGAGVVDGVGDDVSTFRVGDRVWVWDAAWRRHEGTSQEYVALPERQVVHLPDNASFDVGASLGIPALTAHRALTSFAEGPVELGQGALAGKTVLVQGGTGAVGHAAVQLAAWAGAQVVTTVGDERKVSLARAAGAHHVIDYRSQNAHDEIRRISPSGPDIIVEVNAHANLPMDISVIAAHGGISIYTPGGSETRIPSYQAMTKNVQFSFILTYTTSPAQKQAAVRAVSNAIAAGALGVGDAAGLPLTRFPLSETAAAHTAVENHTTGKVLIDIDN